MLTDREIQQLRNDGMDEVADEILELRDKVSRLSRESAGFQNSARALLDSYLTCERAAQEAWENLNRRKTSGGQLANVAFNLAQRCGHTLTSDDCAMLDKLRKQWDLTPNG